MKTNSLLIAYPLTRINDKFVDENNNIDFFQREFDRDPMIKGYANDPNHFFQVDFYQKIGVDIVAETVFDYPYPYITEKTFRPISCMRPFIVLGPYQTLELVKSFGFQTFSAIIDESYDQIQNPVDRFHSVSNSIKLFVSQSLEKVKEDLRSINSILEHNYNTLEQLQTQELERLKAKLENDQH